jgi:protein-S-isoprenylcysteine O-methyltransferase Ste14
MNIKIIIIVTIAYLYGIFEYYISFRQRQKIKIVHKDDKGSLWILSISIALGYLLSFSVAYTRIGRIYHWNILFALGMIIVIVGFMIRIISIRTLKHYFTYSVAKTENHEIIEKGFYKFIRHPWLFRSITNLYWYFYFIIKLAIGNSHVYFDSYWIYESY